MGVGIGSMWVCNPLLFIIYGNGMYFFSFTRFAGFDRVFYSENAV
jgi:hypothetical protein